MWQELPQGRWLRTNLAQNLTKCTLAYFHDPLYASGREHDSPQVRPFWDKLYDQHADVILSGNAHRYERYARITPSGERSSARGIRQFIVGTGGTAQGPIRGPDEPRMQAKKVGAPGVLKFKLGSGFYHWKFVPVEGRKNYTDSGRPGETKLSSGALFTEARRRRILPTSPRIFSFVTGLVTLGRRASGRVVL